MKKFEKPEMEVIVFEAEDIITTSGETLAETHTETPAETHTETPAETHTETPAETHTETPAETSAGSAPLKNADGEGLAITDEQSPATGSETPNPVEQPEVAAPETTTAAEESVSENNFNETVPDLADNQ